MKKKFSEFKTYIKGKNTAVIGIGVSNRPLIKYLVKLGAKVTAFDKKTESELGNIINELRELGVNFELGENYLDFLEGFEVIFKTPSMRIDSPALKKCGESGAFITSEMDEFIRYCPAKIYGITGSDGKTTTTTIVYNLLKEEGYTTWVGGNIGKPLFTEIENIKHSDKVVLELSSFQLMTIDVSPEVAVVTNVTPNHLDMHKGMDEYVSAKKNIFAFQSPKDLLILNRDNELTYKMVGEAKAKVMQFSRKEQISEGAYFENNKLYLKNKEVCTLEDIKIKGMHNVENFLTAFCTTCDDVSLKTMKKVATTFYGVAHRNEFIREVNGVSYYNDSIGSSPTRTIATISSFEKPVILIAGGYDKKIPFEPLAENGHMYIKSLILMGATKEKIKEVFDKIRLERNIDVTIEIVNSLDEAVAAAKRIATFSDNVVLSPACASFDMFENFEIRGEKYKELVNNL